MFGAIMTALLKAVLIVSAAIGLAVGLTVGFATQNIVYGSAAGIISASAFLTLCTVKLRPQAA